jgi:3-methyl-2-oxobutanoate hydroxymethyltransferase
MNILEFKASKHIRKISKLTCYDYTSAKIMSASQVDSLLVGDSSAMVMHGHPTTVTADTDMIVAHTQAVVRGAPGKFIIADLPFLSYKKSLHDSIDTVQKLMRAGAHAVKLEGAYGNEELIKILTQSGVPVMGHIGMTPQHFHALGGFKVQGRTEEMAQDLIQQALILEKVGCFSIVLECIPSKLAASITEKLKIPTIGIGSGPYVDGQVLVFQDLLGMQDDFKPKFIKTYIDGFGLIKNAVNQYVTDLVEGKFPDLDKHSY